MNNNNNINPTLTPLQIGTLNCRGLIKTSNSNKRKSFIRYLRSQSLDIICIQESHASNSELKSLLHNQFIAKDSIWTKHCGIVCLSDDIKFTDTQISPCERVITTNVSHITHLFDPITLINIYAPARHTERTIFFNNIFNPPSLIPKSPSRCILLGDFNYSYPSSLNNFHLPRLPLPGLIIPFRIMWIVTHPRSPIHFLLSIVDYIPLVLTIYSLQRTL